MPGVLRCDRTHRTVQHSVQFSSEFVPRFENVQTLTRRLQAQTRCKMRLKIIPVQLLTLLLSLCLNERVWLLCWPFIVLLRAV